MDSLDKIIHTYVAGVTREPFTYKKHLFTPKPLSVSPLIFRDYTCPPGCAGCCPRFSLVYLPFEAHPYPLQKKVVQINNLPVTLYEDRQEDITRYHCRNVMEDGRCSVHGKQPFSCDFELLRFIHFKDKSLLMTKLFGRGWNLLKIDGTRGALCEIVEMSEDGKADIYRKLSRLQDWCTHLGVKNTYIPDILQYIATGPHSEPLHLR